MQKYVLEYPSPPAGGQARIDEVLKVETFSVAQAYNSTAMVYRPTPFKSETYAYHRWRVNPGNLVSDYLARDLRNSGLFKAVLAGGSAGGNTRFLLEGGVEEFQEIDEPDGWKAALTLNITLLDLSQTEITKRVVFQKNYRAVEPMTEQTPRGLAEGMSRALASLSPQIITDIYQGAKRAGK
jgi:cholesterol transport system auxiliary component